MAAVSKNTDWIVRVTPGNSIGDVYGFSGSPKGPYAEASLLHFDSSKGSYTLQTKYRTENAVSPVDVLVTNEGWLIALDNWHNYGIGAVLATYDANGKLIQSLTLSDIFDADQAKELDHSVSSIWWRCGRPMLEDFENVVVIEDSLDRILSINYVDGVVKVVGESDNCVDDDT